MILHTILFIIYMILIFTQLRITHRLMGISLPRNRFLPRAFIGVVFALIWAVLFGVTYWYSLNLFSKPVETEDLQEKKIFQKFNWDDAQPSYPHVRLKKKDLIEFLKIRNRGPGLFGSLYCLTGDREWAERFKRVMLMEAGKNKFLKKDHGSNKSWQAEVAERAYFYQRINDLDDSLFTRNEKIKIVRWFKTLNEFSLRVTWADLAYAALFKQRPLGLYYNQEIGFGMLAVLNIILEGEYPEMVKKNRVLLKKHSVGWRGNFRNTDDGIIYHHNIWVQMAYLLSRYGGIGHPQNVKWAIDWIKHQSPIQAGIHPIYNYNYKKAAPALASLLIGIHLTNDSTYRFLADNYLQHMIKHNHYPETYIGIDLWTDTIPSHQPNHQSVFILGSTGTNRQVKRLRPDKLIARKMIRGEELFILVNMRSSGWHRYNGSGSVVSVQMGGAVLLKDNYLKKKDRWLPSAKRLHRDKKIGADELNIWQKKSRGMERLFFRLLSFDSHLEFKNYPNFIEHFEVSPGHIDVKLDDDTFLVISEYKSRLTIVYRYKNITRPVLDRTL